MTPAQLKKYTAWLAKQAQRPRATCVVKPLSQRERDVMSLQHAMSRAA